MEETADKVPVPVQASLCHSHVNALVDVLQ
jgi:hypothetical protein